MTPVKILLALLIASLNSSIFAQSLSLQDRQQIVMLGDSITEGEDPDGYVNLTRLLLEQLYPEKTIYVANAGKGGHTCLDLLDRLERDVLRFKPDWVTISIGVNDVSKTFPELQTAPGEKGLPVSVFREKVEEIVHRLKAQGSRVALFTTTVVKEDLSSTQNQKLVFYNKVLRDLAQKNQCVLVDMDSAFRKVLSPLQKPGMAQSGVLTSDGVHMLPNGNWLMAKTFLTALGAPSPRIDAIKAVVMQTIAEQQAGLAKNLDHYRAENATLITSPRSQNRIVLIGSSAAAQWDLTRSFPGYQMINRGICSETIRQLRMRFHQDAVALNPDAVIIFPGYLDDLQPAKRMSSIDVESHLARIARLAKGSAIPVALCSAGPMSRADDRSIKIGLENISKLNDRIKKLCLETGYFYIDCFSALADEQGFLKSEFTDNGIDCNAAGYNALNPLIQETLLKLRWQTCNLRENGTIPLWTVAGRFPNIDVYHHTPACFGYFKDWLVPSGGETKAVPRPGDRVGYEENKQVEWISACSDTAGLLDYLQILKIDYQTAGVCYAYCRLLSEIDQPATLHIRSNDGVRVWLNHEMVHDHHVGRTIRSEEDQVVVNLRKGANPLLVKVDQSGGGWALVVKLTDEKNKPIQQVNEAVRCQLSARQIAAAEKGDVHGFEQSDEPMPSMGISHQFEFSINDQRCTLEQSDYAIAPGRPNLLSIKAIKAKQGQYLAELTRLLPNGRSDQQRALLLPDGAVTLNLGLFAMPAIFDYRAGVVYRKGYRFKIVIKEMDGNAVVEERSLLQTISADNLDEVIQFGDEKEKIHLGWEPFAAHQPMDPPVLLWLDEKVLDDQDSVTMCFQLADNKIASLPGLMQIQNLENQKPIFIKKVMASAHLQRLSLCAAKWKSGDYQLVFEPQVPGCNDHEGPSLVYHHSAKHDKVRLSPFAPWAFERDRTRSELIVTDFDKALKQWSMGLPEAGHWRLVQDSGRTCLVNESGDWKEPPVVLRPNLKGWYAIYAKPVKGYCYIRAGKEGIPKGIAAERSFVAAMDLTDEELAIYAAVEPGSGLQELQFVPIIKKTAQKLLALISKPEKPLVGVADWGDYFCPPPIFHSAGGRPAADQHDALLQGHAELGIRSINWALGRSVLIYQSKLPEATVFPGVALDIIQDQTSRAISETHAWMIANQDPLSYVLEHRDKAGVKIIPWLTMNRHYGEFFDEGSGASKWFKAHPEWRRWRKNAYGPCQGEVSYFFPEVRKERVDIFCEVATKSPDGLLIGACRQPPMLGYEPELVKAYQRLTGLNAKDIDASKQIQDYENWIRWRADFFTETLRQLRDRLAPVSREAVRTIPVSIRIPSKGFFVNMAQGLDVETWCREKLITRIQLDPLEDCNGAGSHDVTPYIKLGRRYGIEVYGGINCNTWWNYQVIYRRALGLLRAGVDGIELYESNNHAVLHPQRWIVPMLGNADAIERFLQTSNLSACFPIWSRNAAAGHDNHSFRDAWSMFDMQGWGL